MLIHTRSIGFALTDSIRRYVDSRVRAALAPYARHVVRVMVRLEDVNAGRGGIDKRCRVMAALCRRGVVIVESVHGDLYAAVDDARDRLRRAASRAARRRVGRERKAARVLAAPSPA